MKHDCRLTHPNTSHGDWVGVSGITPPWFLVHPPSLVSIDFGSGDEHTELENLLNELMLKGVANNTRQRMQRMLERFHAFVQGEGYREYPIESQIMLFVTFLLNKPKCNGEKDPWTPIKATTALNYLYLIRKGLELTQGQTLPMTARLGTFSSALRVMAGTQEIEQAVPATLEEMKQVGTSTHLSMEEKALIELGWVTAARVDDLLRLEWRDVAEEMTGVTLTFRRTKGDRFGLGTVLSVEISSYHHLQQYLRSNRRSESAVVFEMSYARVVAALKTINASWSGHSLRRGALIHLARQGFALEDIQDLARHASVISTRRYVGRENANFQRARTAKTLSASLQL